MVTIRSLLIGLAGVAFICGLTPYNDFVLNNTFLVGNFLPIGLVLFLLVVLVNAPLHWAHQLRVASCEWRDRPHSPLFLRMLPAPLSGGELAVILGMILVSCTLPSSGLMRYVPSHLVAFYHHAGEGGDKLELLRELDLPDWLFPEMEAEGVLERANDPVVRDWWNRVWVDEPSFRAFMGAIPWSAWVRPMMTWGLLLVGLYGAVLCMSVIVRRQWVENERLTFPLATVYLSLIESPKEGRGLNGLFRARSFWIAFAAVFVIHGFNAMHQYIPRVWPEIPVSFNLAGVYADSPLRFTDWAFKQSRLYFSIIGIALFLQTKIAFSLWAFYVLYNVGLVLYGSYQRDFTAAMEQDQTFGALVPFALAIVWVGRHHWAMVGRQMVRAAQAGEPQGRYLPYPLAGWGLVGCSAGVVVWLWTAGMTLAGAVVLMLLLMLVFLVVARVVAETGLIFVQIFQSLGRPWVYMLNDVPEALAVRTTLRTYFFTNWFHVLWTHDLRESLSPYAMHAMRVADDAAYGKDRPAQAGRPNWGRGVGFMGALALALGTGFFISGTATLYVNYAYGATQDVQQTAPINPYGMVGSVDVVMNAGIDYLPPRTGPTETHNRLGHFAFGAGLTGVLSVLRLWYVNWPLHPVGFLLVYSYPIKMIWFSLLVGWLAKVVVVRLGGAELFRGVRPLFIGMIIGEAGAAAFWLVVSLVLNWLGMEYHAVRLLPQ